MLAPFRENGAPNSSRSTSGNSSATSSAINVPSTHTSTSTGCRSSSSTGSVTVPSFLSTYSTNGGTFVDLEDLLAENIRAQERIVALGLF